MQLPQLGSSSKAEEISKPLKTAVVAKIRPNITDTVNQNDNPSGTSDTQPTSLDPVQEARKVGGVGPLCQRPGLAQVSESTARQSPER